MRKPLKINIFLACSLSLVDERTKLELSLHGEEAKVFCGDNVSITLIKSDNKSKTMAVNGSQYEIDEIIRQCQIFIILYHTSIGRHTLHEFEVAFQKFTATGSIPKIFPCYKREPVDLRNVDHAALAELEQFRQNMRIKHYEEDYENIADLKFKVIQEILRYIRKIELANKKSK